MNYYSVPRVSQSYLKALLEGRIEEYLKEGELNFDLKRNDSLVYGKAADCKLTTPENFEKEFIIVDFELPTDPVIKAIKHLVDTNQPLQVDPDYMLSINFEGFGKSRYKESKALNNLKKAEYYYDFLINSKDKIPLDLSRLGKVNHCIKAFTNSFTSEFFDTSLEVQNQLAVYKEVEEVQCKGLLDRLLINSKSTPLHFSNGYSMPPKSATIIDLKTGYMKPENFLSYFYRWKIYFQMAFYQRLLQEDYSLNLPVILYATPSSPHSCWYELSNGDMTLGKYGGYYKYYKTLTPYSNGGFRELPMEVNGYLGALELYKKLNQDYTLPYQLLDNGKIRPYL